MDDQAAATTWQETRPAEVWEAYAPGQRWTPFGKVAAEAVTRTLPAARKVLAPRAVRAGRPVSAWGEARPSDPLVGARGFEPPAPASRTQCSTRLSYAPTGDQAALYRQCPRSRQAAARQVSAAAARVPGRSVASSGSTASAPSATA